MPTNRQISSFSFPLARPSTSNGVAISCQAERETSVAIDRQRDCEALEGTEKIGRGKRERTERPSGIFPRASPAETRISSLSSRFFAKLSGKWHAGQTFILTLTRPLRGYLAASHALSTLRSARSAGGAKPRSLAMCPR